MNFIFRNKNLFDYCALGTRIKHKKVSMIFLSIRVNKQTIAVPYFKICKNEGAGVRDTDCGT